MTLYEDYRREQYESSFDAIPLGWWNDPWFSNPFPMGGSIYPVLRDRSKPTTVTVPDVRVQPALPEAVPSDTPVAGVETLPASVVIDPDFRPQATVFEDAPGGIYETNRAPTDWGAVYDAYVILNAPEPAPEVQEVIHGSIDWGSVVGTIIGGAADPFGAGRYAAGLFNQPTTALPGVPAVVATAAAPVRIDPRTGRPVCKRRRRRRLLTDGDFNDLMRISTLPNKDIVKIALAKAVGR